MYGGSEMGSVAVLRRFRHASRILDGAKLGDRDTGVTEGAQIPFEGQVNEWVAV